MKRQYPTFHALHRPILVMGAERDLVLTALLACFLIGYAGMSLTMVIAGIVLFLVILKILRMMAKKDPILSRVWMRQIGYKKYYRARPVAIN